jgi:hypothetical protein
MRRNFAILTVGLALSVSLCIPATEQARADTDHGCGSLQNIGSENYGRVDTSHGALYFTQPHEVYGDDFCNIGIPVNGQFQILDDETGAGGCLSVNTSDGEVIMESAAACGTSGGKGYPWDRWTAISIQYHSNQLWMFQSVYEPGFCIENDQSSLLSVATTYYEPCDPSNHYQWFGWQGSNL